MSSSPLHQNFLSTLTFQLPFVNYIYFCFNSDFLENSPGTINNVHSSDIIFQQIRSSVFYQKTYQLVQIAIQENLPQNYFMISQLITSLFYETVEFYEKLFDFIQADIKFEEKLDVIEAMCKIFCQLNLEDTMNIFSNNFFGILHFYMSSSSFLIGDRILEVFHHCLRLDEIHHRSNFRDLLLNDPQILEDLQAMSESDLIDTRSDYGITLGQEVTALLVILTE